MISVVITNYNKEAYIKDTLNSLIHQIDKNFELIFFDDNSTDNSFNIAKSILIKNKKYKYKILKRKKKKSRFNSYNQISAINHSIKYCTGDYVSLLDADDIFLKEKIKNLNKLIKKNKKKIFLNSYYILKNKKTFSNKRHFKIRKFIWPIFPPTSCITIEKKLFKEILKKISFNKFPSCWLDFRLSVYLAKYHKNQIIYLKDKLTTYRKNNDGSDNIYTNVFSIHYWQRKYEAFMINIKI